MTKLNVIFKVFLLVSCVSFSALCVEILPPLPFQPEAAFFQPVAAGLEPEDLEWSDSGDEEGEVRPSKKHRAVPQTPLADAVEAQDLETVRRLILDEGHIVNEQNRFGATALHLAAAIGNLEMIQTLLVLGADPRLPNFMNETPIGRARSYGNEEAANALENWNIQ